MTEGNWSEFRDGSLCGGERGIKSLLISQLVRAL